MSNKKCDKYIDFTYSEDGVIMGRYKEKAPKKLTIAKQGDGTLRIEKEGNGIMPSLIKRDDSTLQINKGDDDISYNVIRKDDYKLQNEKVLTSRAKIVIENLSSECCSEMGYNYDNETGKCYYRENLCKDINDNWVNQFVFEEDGFIYGYYLGIGVNKSTSNRKVVPDTNVIKTAINPECCTKLGYEFNYDKNGCQYKDGCDERNIKIVFNVDGNNGLVFTKNGNENCNLNLNFEYLINYDVIDITKYFNDLEISTERQGLNDVIDGLKLKLLIEKKVDGDLETILERDLYSLSRFDGYNDCGIKLDGLDSTINALFEDDTLLNEVDKVNILKSELIQHNLEIDDPTVIENIINEEIVFSILIEDMVVDFSIEMDNITLDKVCEKEVITTKTISESPSYDLIKTVDNKKSWVSTDKNRVFDLKYRDTDYDITNERLVINSKEIDLESSISNAIEEDVALFIKKNPSILVGDGRDGHSGIDLSKFLSKKVENIKFIKDIIKLLYTELIDVKTRKIISNYPDLRLVYERYLNSEHYIDVKSNGYHYDLMDSFLVLLGDYWVDLIEQVIPATTLWGSTNIIKNVIFNDNKFKYRKYSLKFCESNSLSITENLNVEVITNYLSHRKLSDKNYVCNRLYVDSYNYDASTIDFIGSESNGNTNGNTSGTITYINEN